MGDAVMEIQNKMPKKTLYFSDGIIEEFSEEEDDDTSEDNKDESSMEWTPWLLLKTGQAAKNLLAGADFVGEKLASILQITTPKYGLEIEEFKRTQEAAEKAQKEDAEGDWTRATHPTGQEVNTTAPAMMLNDLSVEKK